MRKLLLLSFVLLLCLVRTASAQDRTVSGKVTADDGSPLPGVNVAVRGTTRGVTTDANGAFRISAPDNATLVFSSIGFGRQNVAIGNRTSVDVQLISDASELSEVVVTGYGGVLNKREVTGAISQIKGAEIANIPSQSFDRALQGRLSGVQVTSANGVPGGAVQVRIRGIGSITAGNDPLYVVDGVQLNTQNNNSVASSNPLNFLNPNDIESIEVLKDAAAASIYGSQAANGVVLITTKKGRSGRTQVNVNAFYGIVEPIQKLNVLNSANFVRLRAEALANNNPALTPAQALTSALSGIRLPNIPSELLDTLRTYDWQDAAFRTGVSQNYDLSISGGSDRNSFYWSAAYTEQDANVLAVDFKRLTSSLRLTQKLSEKVQFEQSINISTTTQRGQFGSPNGGSFLGSPSFSSPLMVPTNPIYNPDGTFFGTPATGGTAGILNQNIIQVALQNRILSTTNQVVANVGLNYKITPNLTFRPTINLDYRAIKGDYYTDPRTADGFGVRGRAFFASDQNVNFLTNATLLYTRQFDSHGFSALGGVEFRNDTREGNSGTGEGFPTPDFKYVNSAANPTALGGFWTGYRKFSVFGKVDYNYASRYFVSFTGRYDGSSRFGANNQYGFFPAISASWLISDEEFLKGSSVLSTLKLRASHGVTGNDAIGNFDSRGLYGGGANYNGIGGIDPTSLANPNLRWERNVETSIGLEYQLFGNRISGQFDVFNRISNDLLLQRQIPNTSGFTTITENTGALQNRGFEMEITTQNFQSDRFKWRTSFNFTVIDNKVTRLYDGIRPQANRDSLILVTAPVQAGNTTTTRNFIVGKPVNAVFTARYAGVNPANGRPMWYDENGNITYLIATPRDSKYLGSDFARIFGGLTNVIEYGGFELTAFFNYEYGRWATNNQGGFAIENGQRTFNTLQSIYDARWTTPGQITDVPRAINGGAELRGSGLAAGSRTIEDASFIRLKQVQLAYTFPANWMTQTKVLRTARLFVQATNLLTWTNWTGYDPEFVSVGGNGNNGLIPQSRTYTAGVQLGF